MISYKINESLNIVETKFEGEITIKEMFDYIISIRENKALPQKLKIYSDALQAKFAEEVTPRDLITFLEANEITLRLKEYIYDAFVVSNTFETALGILYKELNKIENYKVEIFSTKKAAIDWLMRF